MSSLPRSSVVLRTPFGMSGRLHRRTLLTCAILLLGALTVAFISLMLGEVTFSPGEVVDAVLGRGGTVANLFVGQWRLPRALCALGFGAMLGVAGAMFQTITRNPLGSPDIIGFTTGAYTGGIVAILLVGSGFWVVAGGSVIGGLVTAAIVYGLSRNGGVQGFRLIIVGIALTAMLASFDTWLILTAELDMAIVAAAWGAGSLNGVTFAYSTPALVLGALLLLAASGLSRRLGQLDLGDEQAGSLGSRPEVTRLLAVHVSVGLVAVVTAVAGPIAFVALAAPHIGRRLCGATGTPMLPAACAGALVLAGADLAAQHAIPGTTFPVGVVTVALGGAYLLALIVGENRKGTL